jgi:GH24 family phage-related lysozyme (muramidase)
MNIFEGTVEQPSITGYTSEVAPDTSVGDTINLVGSTIWETYKGAQIAKFKDNEVNEWNPQVLMGSKPDDPKQYGWSPELSEDLGLEQLQRGIDQGTLDVDQAEAMANAKFKELVNRLPAVTPEARQALNIWKMGHSSAGRSGGSGKPQTREEIMRQAELDNYKEYLESGYREAGYSEEYYLKMKGNKAVTEAKEKLDVASGNAGKDTVANKTSLATLNYRVSLGKLQQQYNNGDISETDFANMRRVEQVKAMNQYRIDVDTAIASNPAGASEMKEEMTRGLEEMKLMFEQQEQLSPEQQAATALETQVLLEKYNAHNNMAMARAANIFPAVVMEHLLKSATGTVQREYMQDIADNFETIMSENDALTATANKFMDNLLRSKAGASFTPRPDANPQTAAPFNKATMSNQDAKVGGPEQALNVIQMLSNLETDRYGMLAEALANKPTDYLMPADKKDITGTVNSFMHGIEGVLYAALRQYINDGGDLRRTLNSEFAGFKFRKETDRQLINLMRIMAKNPSLFGQAEYDKIVDLAARASISDELIDFYFKEAGIDYKREETEAKELPSLEPISMDLKPEEGEMDFTFLKDREGFSDKPYKDHKQMSIGYGTKAKPEQASITKSEAEADLRKHVDEQVFNYVVGKPWYEVLNPQQKEVVVSLVYNVGWGAFSKSKAYKALKDGDTETFLREAFDPEVGFVRASGEVNEGLQTRRRLEQERFTGVG